MIRGTIRRRALAPIAIIAIALCGCEMGGGQAASSSPAEDREAIRDTLRLYAVYLDDARVDDFLGLFTDDAIFTAAEFEYRGHDEIRRELAVKKRRPGKHLPMSAVIEFESDTAARAWSDFLRVKIEREGDPTSWVITSIGRYHDRLVRGRDGRWRFARRDVHMPARSNPREFIQPGMSRE